MIFTHDNLSSAWHDAGGRGYRITPTLVAVSRQDGFRTVRDPAGVERQVPRIKNDLATRWYACVRAVGCEQSAVGSGRRPFWDFCGKRCPLRTFEAAVKACARHAAIWERALKIQARRGQRLPHLVKLVERTRPRGPKHKRYARKTYLTPSPLTSVPAWADVTSDFLKLLAKARTSVLKAEQKSQLARG